jgi:hypothetical protein
MKVSLFRLGVLISSIAAEGSDVRVWAMKQIMQICGILKTAIAPSEKNFRRR